MKRPALAFLVAAIVALIALGSWLAYERFAGHRPPSRIVYASPPDSPDTASFVRLLEQHFPQVRTIPVSEIATADFTKDDVLVVGGSYKEEGPRGLSIDSLTIPTVLIGGMGGRISDNLDLKLGWRYG